MITTPDLITKLSSESKASKPLARPLSWILFLLTELLLYAVVLQIFVQLRFDLLDKLMQPIFLLEVGLVILLLVSSIIAAVLTMYPDLYQKSFWLKIPYLIFCLLLGFFLSQLFVFHDAVEIISSKHSHGLECAAFILASAFFPAAFIFTVLKRGASIVAAKSGLFVALAANSLGYLLLRLQENNDAIIHLFLWHYLPILFFALLGTFFGRWLLRW